MKSLTSELHELVRRKNYLNCVASYLFKWHAQEAPTRNQCYLLFAILLLSTVPSAVAAQSAWVHGEYRAGDFKLVYGGRAADILISPEDFKVVQIAGEALAADVERVTGKKPVLRREAAGLYAPAIIAGTFGQSPLIDALVRAGKLDVKSLRRQWEIVS